MMRAGRLDRIITLKRKETTENEFGEEIISWVEFANVWAERLELRGDERWNAQQVISTVACKYRIRYRDDVSPLDILIDAGKEYDIAAVLELGRKEGLELICAGRGE